MQSFVGNGDVAELNTDGRSDREHVMAKSKWKIVCRFFERHNMNPKTIQMHFVRKHWPKILTIKITYFNYFSIRQTTGVDSQPTENFTPCKIILKNREQKDEYN